jgi:hypothetical protein
MTAGDNGPSFGVPLHFFIQTLWVRILKLTIGVLLLLFCDVFADVFIHDIVKIISMKEMVESLKKRIKG